MLGEVTLEDEVAEAAASVMSPAVQPDEALDRKLLHARIKWALSRLTKKEAAAIRLRFGLDERPPQNAALFHAQRVLRAACDALDARRKDGD